jgi:hypothetical protein
VTAARLIDGDLGKQRNVTHRSDGDFRNGSVTWSSVASVVRLPRMVFLRGDQSEVESNGRCVEAPARCVIARGPDSVVSFCQVECGDAAALRQRVPHDGGLLGVVQSASVGFLLTQDHAAGFGDYVCECWWVPRPTGLSCCLRFVLIS